MLEPDKIDLDRIASAARRRGFTSWELFAETSYHCTVDIQSVGPQGRLEDVRLSTSGGIALRTWDGRAARHFSTNTISTKALLALLGEDNADPQRVSAPTPLPGEPEKTRRKKSRRSSRRRAPSSGWRKRA